MLGKRLQSIGAEFGKAGLPAFKSLIDVLNDFADQSLSKFQSMGPMLQRWGQRVADAVPLARTAFSEIPSWLNLAWLHLKEWFDNVIDIAKPLRPALTDLFKEGSSALATIAADVGKEIGRSLVESMAGVLQEKFEALSKTNCSSQANSRRTSGSQGTRPGRDRQPRRRGDLAPHEEGDRRDAERPCRRRIGRHPDPPDPGRRRIRRIFD